MISAPASPARLREHEVKWLVNMVRLSRATLLVAEPGSDKSGVLQSIIMPLLSGPATDGKAEIAVLFDAWDKDPLPALHARMKHAAGADAAAVPLTEPSSLLASIRAWEEALDVTFFIILDRFEEHLRASHERADVASFDRNLAEVLNDPLLRTSFLLALDEDAEPLLAPLRNRIPELGYSRVRLPGANAAAQPRFPEHDARGDLFTTSHEAPPHVREQGIAKPETSPAVPLHIATNPMHDSGAQADAPPVRNSESSIIAAAALLEAQRQAATAKHAGQAHALDSPRTAEAVTSQPSAQPNAPEAEHVLPIAEIEMSKRPAEQVAATVAHIEQVESSATRDASPPTVTPLRVVAPKRGFRRSAWAASILIPAALVLFWASRKPSELVPSLPADETIAVTSRIDQAPEPDQNIPAARPIVTGTPAVPLARPEITGSNPAPIPSTAPLITAVPAVPPSRNPDTTAAKPAAGAREPSRVTGAVTEPKGMAAVPIAPPAQAAMDEGASAPVLRIHVQSEAQRAWARQLIRPLNERGIRVAEIKVMPSGPDQVHIRYYRAADRNEAMKVAVALRDFGLSAQHLKQMEELESPAPARQYDLWLPPAGYDERP